jgi:hypothetical protein
MNNVWQKSRDFLKKHMLMNSTAVGYSQFPVFFHIHSELPLKVVSSENCLNPWV